MTEKRLVEIHVTASGQTYSKRSVVRRPIELRLVWEFAAGRTLHETRNYDDAALAQPEIERLMQIFEAGDLVEA